MTFLDNGRMCFPGVNWLGHGAVHPHPSSAEVEHE
jgi:hypothetical protein